MLSSAQKSVPTTKQFRQPYFMDIAPDGTILSTCARFGALMKKRNIPNFLGSSFVETFSLLGKIEPPVSTDLFTYGLPRTIDLSIQWPGAKSFIIRWIPTPRYAVDVTAGGWQLTGGKVYAEPFPTEQTNKMQDDGKKSYLISAIRYVEDSDWRITGIMESITDGFFVLDQDFRVKLWNHEAERITRLSAEEMTDQPIWEKLPEWAGGKTGQSFHQAFKKKMAVTFEQYYERSDHWLEMSLYPSDQGMFAYVKEVTFRKKQEALLTLEKKVLELNTARHMSLQALLNFFLKGIQKIFPGMYCMVLTLDEDNVSARLLSAPGLPAIYAHAIDGLPIGPNAGSCGTAMYRKETVIVSDIATDPLWSEYRDLALQFGLRACWSIPVMNNRDEVLASFSVYYTTAKAPTQAEMDIFERVAGLVTIIIEGRQMEEKLVQQEANKQKLIARAIVDA